MRRRYYRTAAVLLAAIVTAAVAMAPLTFWDMLNGVVGPPGGRPQALLPPSPVPPSPTRTHLHVAIIALDELRQRASLEVSGHHVCAPACTWSDRVVLSALDDADAEGLPPSASVTLPPTAIDITTTVELPIAGTPLRYPFDSYVLTLGIIHQRVYPDGRTQVLTPTEAPGHLFTSLQERLPLFVMEPPVALAPETAGEHERPWTYPSVFAVRFERPLYLRILATFLVLLMGTTAAYVVFLRPLDEIVVNQGALILGVWGIRSILVADGHPFFSALELSLSMVVLFMLVVTAIRVLAFCRRQAAAAPGTGPSSGSGSGAAPPA